MKRIFFFSLLLFSGISFGIESLNDFLVTSYDDRYKVISPEKFKANMEVIVENKTLIRLIGKLVLNQNKIVGYVSIEPDKYQKLNVSLKKTDVLHFYPMSPAFQEVELIVGNKTYEIPPKK